jgi:deoxyribonuclease IV
MLIGAHVSIAGGLELSLDRGIQIGATAIQTFASSPRTIHFSPVSPGTITKYLDKKKLSPIKFHVFHGVYLINLAHTNLEYVALCVKSLIAYQQLAGSIGGFGTIFHVGSHKGLGLPVYLDQIARAIAGVINASPPEVWLLLENTAGQKGAIGQHFTDLKTIIDAVGKLGADTSHLGIGLDTQHAFASGHDLTKPEGLNKLLDEIDHTVGLSKLQLLHVNDSMFDLASNRDRHANIGEGKLGAGGISLVVNHPQLRPLPMILEVPGAKAGPRLEDVKNLIALCH